MGTVEYTTVRTIRLPVLIEKELFKVTLQTVRAMSAP